MADELVQQRLLRWKAGALVLVLDAHRELPVLTWTVTAPGETAPEDRTGEFPAVAAAIGEVFAHGPPPSGPAITGRAVSPRRRSAGTSNASNTSI